MNDFRSNLADYIRSGHALLYIETFEKDRAICNISDVAEDTKRQIYVWSISEGWKDCNNKSVDKAPPAMAPVHEHIQAILEFPDNTICVLRDFGMYLNHSTYPGCDIVIGWLDTLRKITASVGQTIIFVGPDLEIPKQLLHDITTIDFNLPDEEQINERIQFACSDVKKADGEKFVIDASIVPEVIDACRGMTSQQVVDRVTLSLCKHKDLNADAIHTITREKASIIKASGLLTYTEPPDGGLDIVGGYDALKQHILLDKPCFTQEARDFGIEFPKGILLVGVMGCGKTLLSLAIASELGLPLVSMDVGNLMNKYVGESEHNMREAIKMLESVCPLVLQLDEVEKSFGGTGDSDGGSSRRVFGTFIKWLNDRQSPIYVVATANQIESLPPEFSRKGRFDEIYSLDLPSQKERIEIFNIHLSKRNRKPDDFVTSELSIITDGYSGADIEQIIKLGLKIAFSNNTKLKTSHLIQATSNVIPLSKTEPDRIEIIRKWCKKHAKPANPQGTAPQSNNVDTRKVDLN
jgi:ATP-dependent 26S proteasome regulatory subunit